MLIFIENTPRTYAWGSREALPDMLGVAPTGEPQAELWLGAHPGSPAHIAKASQAKYSLIDLIAKDPERYGVAGGQLPFLLKVLAIGAPLSLQVHPSREQAEAGFAAEEAAGIPLGARSRNYGDANHKPELLVALSDMRALSGFRPLADARRDVRLLAGAARRSGDEAGADALDAVGDHLRTAGRSVQPSELRRAFLEWVFSDDQAVARALAALATVADPQDPVPHGIPEMHPDRFAVLLELVATHPGDPGVLVSLLLHLVRLAPGESIFLGPRQIHAYLSGIGVEVMAASDNVLRAGLTEKHIDVAELCRIVDTRELEDPRFSCTRLARGLVAWDPPVPDFRLLRARLCEPDADDALGATAGVDSSPSVEVPCPAPVVLVVTSGQVQVDRPGDFAEVARARRGQCLYVSAGDPIVLTGHGEAFLATVGA